MNEEQVERLLEEKGGCSPMVGCGCAVPGCLLPIAGLVAALTVFIGALVF